MSGQEERAQVNARAELSRYSHCALLGASLGSLLPTGFLLFALASEGAVAEKGLLEALEIGRAIGTNFEQELSGAQIALGQDKALIQSIFTDFIIIIINQQ